MLCLDPSRTRPIVDLTGAWTLVGQAHNDESEWGTMNLTRSGTSVTGTATMSDGAGTVTGAVKGSEISITFGSSAGYQVYTSGTVSDNTIVGSFTDSDGDSGTWSASRR